MAGGRVAERNHCPLEACTEVQTAGVVKPRRISCPSVSLAPQKPETQEDLAEHGFHILSSKISSTLCMLVIIGPRRRENREDPR